MQNNDYFHKYRLMYDQFIFRKCIEQCQTISEMLVPYLFRYECIRNIIKSTSVLIRQRDEIDSKAGDLRKLRALGHIRVYSDWTRHERQIDTTC